VLDHPLIQHKLTLMRKKETSTTSFRRSAQRDRHR
jgi:uracil phosphoribosyltransferase